MIKIHLNRSLTSKIYYRIPRIYQKYLNYRCLTMYGSQNLLFQPQAVTSSNAGDSCAQDGDANALLGTEPVPAAAREEREEREEWGMEADRQRTAASWVYLGCY